MVRSRVLSLISSFGGPSKNNNKDSSASSSSTPAANGSAMGPNPSSYPQNFASIPRESPPPSKTGRDRSNSRPMSIIQGHQPPLMEVAQDTLPELQPIFNFLNNHQNKLYQEGFFLKLNDLDTQGRPFADRQWAECFAQLIGTVLSLWDAAALDAAGQDGEVAPTFINLADASIQMIETLPTRNEGMQPLQNVLSISTAAKNRYLLHFNSLHSLTQWTAGIRLAMFEHASLQESYTGSLIAGKGKSLNSIRAIMERSRFKQEDWARVRFGAGTPWRRCWCVITPPDEKEYQKAQKAMKKKSAYGRAAPVIKGDIKFYESKKINKKTQPIATITDAYSAYAIYPQSKPLIEMSTLVKVEGQITTHAPNKSTVEGFVFVMPEVHPAVSGFEIMLRWLFPVFDTFNLYGRPTRLVADTVSTRSLMFALPSGKKYGYLETLDVANLVHTEGSSSWSEKEWRKRLKDLTSQRMLAAPSGPGSNGESKNYQRSSLPARNGGARYSGAMAKGPVNPEYNRSSDAVYSLGQNSRPGTESGMAPGQGYHGRSNSEMSEFAYRNQMGGSYTPSRLSVQAETDADSGPQPPAHGPPQYDGSRPGTSGTTDRSSSGSDYRYPSKGIEAQDIGQGYPSHMPPDPVAMPPAFAHSPGEVPRTLPNQSPDLRREKSRMSQATLSQLVDAGKMGGGGGVAAAGAAAAWNGKRGSGDQGQRVVIDDNTSANRATADRKDVYEGINPGAPPTPQAYAPPTPTHEFIPTPESPPAPTHHPETLPPLTTNMNRMSISRKPLPAQQPQQRQQQQQPYENDIFTPATESSLGSLRHNIDQDALDRIVARRPSFSTEKDVRQDEESVYDNDSVASPDYASSTDTKPSVNEAPRPRSGVMRTVGAPAEDDEVVIGDVRYSRGKPARTEDPDLPLVDFGPTQAYMPTTRRPSTSDTLTKFGHAKKPSDATIGGNDRRYSSGRQKSPGPALDGRRQSRSPRGDDRRRSVIWQPGMATGRASPGPRITPEQFVQRRVAANTVTTPHYAHNRTNTSTTPPMRPASGDWTAHARQQTPRDLPARPHSRGSTMMLNQNDFSSHLSAREQEHVARVTGSSFFNLGHNNNNVSNNKIQPPPMNSGLVGTIDAREREKNEAKQGVSGQMVQHAIAQRQQQAQIQQQQQMAQSYAPSTYGQQIYSPGSVAGWNPQQQYQQQPPQQQQYSNGPNRFYQNGGSQYQQMQPQPMSPPPGYAESHYYPQSQAQHQQQRPQSTYSYFGSGGYQQSRP
ncbi:hypothetical protein FQN54_008193 [Arachnomyces sp. PD_36]|nr:hypothetical protein FQN54_008193 [Arachnomyces sp. PD_36]